MCRVPIERITPAVREVAGGLEFPEGPIALADGSVIVVEMRRRTLSRITPQGAVEVIAELGGGPNGAAVGPDGCVYVTNNGGPNWIADGQGNTLPVGSAPDAVGSIQVVDPRSGKWSTLYDRCDGEPIGAPNDLVFDAVGGFWFTDFGKYGADGQTGGVYYALADGSRIERKIFPLEHPNGIGLSPDGRRLYVAETPTARCWAFDLSAPGGLAAGADQRAVLATLGDNQLFDSLAVDAEGHVCVGTIVTGAVSDIWPDGSRIDQYLLPDPVVTNVCFGGPERRTAFATLSMHGRLVAFDWPRPGAPLNY
ncbi:MAG: SMP-30/gluconolactonase/LRE family protein [Alphaproteobacteria bacterium]|nr:SMP-30/gluconolactonase/LRE family protein [Alphaproteobacteria bacterium]